MPRDYRAPQPHRQHSEPAPPEQGAPGADCPGPCNAAYRAAERRREERGTEHTLTARPGQPRWCPPCATAVRGALGDAPLLAVLLRQQVLYATGTEGEHVSGTRERPLHENEAYALLIDEIAMFLGDWEDTVREARTTALRHYTDNPYVTIDNAARFLSRHLVWLLAHHPEPEASTGFGSDMLALHRRAQNMAKAGEVRPERCEGVACPNCGLNALEWEVDGQGRATGDVRCRVCRPVFVMTADEYAQWTRMLGHDARIRGLATAQVLADAGLPR